MERISFDTTSRNKRSLYASVSCSKQYVMSGYLWSWGAQRSSISSHWTAVNTPNYLFSIALPKEIFVARERGLWYWCAFNVQKPRLYPSCPSLWTLGYWIKLNLESIHLCQYFSVMNKAYYFKSLCLHTTKCIELPPRSSNWEAQGIKEAR